MKSKMRNLLLMSLILFTFSFFSTCFAEPALVQNAKNPKIITDSSGQNICVVWVKNNGTNDIVQTSCSTNFGTTWSTPDNLSLSGQNASSANVICDASASYLYTTWIRSNGTKNIVQFKKSLDFGLNWDSSVDLSNSAQNSTTPYIRTISTGQYVYSMWNYNGTIQFKKSSDYGVNWDSTIDLSNNTQAATDLQITNTDSCICSIWARSNGTNDIIQYRHSGDYGNNWNTTFDLSQIGESASDPQIATSESGSYINAIWLRPENSIVELQYRSSSDAGASFSSTYNLSPFDFSPISPQLATSSDGKYVYSTFYIFNGKYTTILVSISQNYGYSWSGSYVLAQYGQNSQNPQIATSSTSEDAYVVWTRSNKYNDIVQVGYSNDFGSSWTTTGTDLSLPGQDAKNPQVATSSNSQLVYVTWARNDGTKDVIQVSYSSDYGSNWTAPVTISD